MSKIWFKQPANVFEEAFPIGNGKIGGMIYGGVQNEKISLNEDTLWSGYPEDKTNPDVSKSLSDARSLIDSGKKAEAEQLIWKKMLASWTTAYQPAGNLLLEMKHGGDIKDYKRELDLDKALVSVKYKTAEINYQREIFCSYPLNAMIVKITSDTSGSIDCRLSIDGVHPGKIEIGKNILSFTGKAPEYAAPSYYNIQNPIIYGDNALAYCISVTALNRGGNIEHKNNEIIITHTDEVTFIVALATNFEGFDKSPCNSSINSRLICENIINKAIKAANPKEDHINDYNNLYGRVKLHLDGNNREDLPTDERLQAFQNTYGDNGLAALLFNYGRYLLISSSREGTQAANLQGIWNESLRPPWSSNYTLNINAEMNYWLAENCNLSECHLPFLNFIKELSQTGKRTAQVNYNCRGWCVHHNSDLWRQSEPVGKLESNSGSVGYGFWPLGGCWLIRHIWEHYMFTLDINILRDYWDIIEGAAMFLLDFMVEKDGKYIIYPSTSPENRYIENGNALAVTVNSAMDVSLAIDVLSIIISAGKLLDKDINFYEKAFGKLPEVQIGQNGEVLEWSAEYLKAEPHHRHLSHLYGLYPGNSFLKDYYMLASRETMIQRGDEATGWSIGWKINLWARLHDSEKAWELAKMALRPVTNSGIKMSGGGGVYANLFCAHPPFQIDGNFGFSAGIAEMLVQSHRGYIEILPSIPKQWQSGKITGLCARGGFDIDITWTSGEVEVSLFSKKGKLCALKTENCENVVCNGKIIPSVYEKGILSFNTEKGTRYEIILSRK